MVLKKAVYGDLLEVFRSSQDKGVDDLSREIKSCDVPMELKESLVIAVKGDNRPLNKWLFSKGFSASQCISWIAPVKSFEGHYKYVWMIGWSNDTSLKVQSWFKDFLPNFVDNPWLIQDYCTPDLLFVDTHEVSKTSNEDVGYEDEFAIFQLGYKSAPVEVGDLNQKMVINTSFITKSRRRALKRLRLSGVTKDHTVLSCIENNLELFSILHSEGHNRGHFVGSWPLMDRVKKKMVLYEAVEEFKACLASIIFVEHMLLTDLQKTAFATSIFMSRFFGYGFDAYKLANQRRETVREITVSMMFFEWLLYTKAIEVDDSGKIYFEADCVKKSLISAYKKIFEQEKSAVERSSTELESIANFWYKLAFPNGDYSQQAKSVYSSL